jgi:hypothetical protein
MLYEIGTGMLISYINFLMDISTLNFSLEGRFLGVGTKRGFL